MGDWAAIKQEQPLQNYRALPDQLSRMRKALVDLEKWAEVLVVGRRARASAAAAAEKGKGKWMERVEGGRVAK